ncbi:MAG: SsrA-binding protein SmpB [Candidatus Edwardsbacteria bacterium]
MQTVATNRKARHDFEILETIETGLVLTGTEVKSVRLGRVSLKESYAGFKGNEAYIYNMHIAPYEQGNRYNPDPKRTRKLLLHRQEISRLLGRITEKGLTLIPISLYFKKGNAKLELGLAKGKKLYDRREQIKKRIMQREVERSFRGKN